LESFSLSPPPFLQKIGILVAFCRAEIVRVFGIAGPERIRHFFSFFFFSFLFFEFAIDNSTTPPPPPKTLFLLPNSRSEAFSKLPERENTVLFLPHPPTPPPFLLLLHAQIRDSSPPPVWRRYVFSVRPPETEGYFFSPLLLSLGAISRISPFPQLRHCFFPDRTP